jgi:hypothetical protein
MKNFCLNTIVSACLFIGATLPSHAENLVQVDFIAPFAFHVGAATLPPGAYRILDSAASGAVIVMAAQGTHSAVAMIGENRVAGIREKTKVTFSQRGGQMFMTSFSRPDGRVAELTPAASR